MDNQGVVGLLPGVDDLPQNSYFRQRVIGIYTKIHIDNVVPRREHRSCTCGVTINTMAMSYYRRARAEHPVLFVT
jgi:hypothetical protein